MTTPKRLLKMQQVAANRQKNVVVVIEDMYDPHNAEAIIRTADCFGIQQVYFIFDTQPAFNPRRVGKATSSSANKWLDFKIFKKLTSNFQSPISKQEKENITSPTEQCLAELKKHGYISVATALSEKAQDVYNFAWPDKVALWLGNEHTGLSQVALNECEHIVYIPMQGFVQSLNVSVSAGIFLSEIYRTRCMSDKKFKLSESDQKKLTDEFVRR